MTKKPFVLLMLTAGIAVGCSSLGITKNKLSYINSPTFVCNENFDGNWYNKGVPFPCPENLYSGTISSVSEREIYHELMEKAWVEGDLSVLDKFIVKDSYDFSPLGLPEKGTKGFERIISSFRSSLSDIKLEHSDMAEGNLVTHFWKLSGYHTKAPLFGVKANGGEIILSGISTVSVKDNKIEARWSQLDIYGLLVQLGMIPKIL